MSVGRFLQQAAAGAGDTGDDDFANVVLLLDGDGTSGDANNTFTDSSANGYTVTESGSVVQGSFSPYGDNWSNYFNGSSKLKASGSSDFAFGTGDFSIDLWINSNNFSSTYGLTNAQTNDSSASAGMFNLKIANSTTLDFGRHGAAQYVSGATSLSVGVWHHLHISRVSSTVRMFVDGSSLTLTNVGGGVDTYDFNNGGAEFTVGSGASFSNFQGHISNLRIIKGTSSENKTANFTPPTAPLTAVTNTVLLTAQSNRFIDNSSSSHTFSTSGTPKVTPFSPFKDSNARTLTTDGGSAYFDNGAGTPTDYLSISDATGFDIGSNQFTFECWVYLESIHNTFAMLFTGEGTNYYFGYHEANGGGLAIYGGWGAYSGNDGRFKLYEWNYLVFQRDNSGTLAMYLNGTQVYSASLSETFGGTSATGVNIGKSSSYNDYGVNGYIADARFSNGFTLYGSGTNPSSITVPTAPLTAISNTDLLLNFQDAGIYDRSGINNLDTVGDAQIDTAVVKYGTGSMQFDGTGDYLKVPSTDDIALGTGDFTIEGWLYIGTNPVGNGQGMFQISNGYLNSAVRGPAAGLNNGDGKWAIYYGTSQQTATAAAPSINTWYHVAYVRNSSTTKLYIDGTELISVSDSTNYSDTYLTIGGWYSTSYLLNGFIDDFRITKGIARYTSSFTPPTAALPKF
jgi:hypothetical protein